MIVQIGIKRGLPVGATVASFKDASEAVRKAIGNRGASQIKHRFLIADGGEIVAHVSYNGRVWAGTEWQSGMVPLYDPINT